MRMRWSWFIVSMTPASLLNLWRVLIETLLASSPGYRLGLLRLG